MEVGEKKVPKGRKAEALGPGATEKKEKKKWCQKKQSDEDGRKGRKKRKQIRKENRKKERQERIERKMYKKRGVGKEQEEERGSRRQSCNG